MTTFNPFKTAEPTARKLKILLFGNWGTGKTWAALTFPRVAMIDDAQGEPGTFGKTSSSPHQENLEGTRANGWPLSWRLPLTV